MRQPIFGPTKMKIQSLPFLVIALWMLAASSLTIRAADRPNILFCIADDASYPHMGAYGCKWIETPGFDRIAREGVLFTNAYTPNAKCAPSRACILTGRNSWQLEQAANHICYFPAKFKSYAEALGDNGYFVGMTAKGWSPGVANDVNGKPRHMAGQPFNAQKEKPPAQAISSNNYAGNFVDFLDARPAEKPWCFWYGSTEPHRRYEYGAGVSKGGKKLTDIDEVPSFWPDTEEVRNDMLDYAFEIEHFDDHLNRMINELEKRGELENTMIVVTSDNGMPFPRVKGQEYEMSNHLPLAIMWKKGVKNPGRTVDDYVSFIDFAPTFIEVAGVETEATGMKPVSGQSLTDILYSEKSGMVNPKRDHVLIGKERHDIGRPNDWGYPIRGIVKGGVMYLHNFETARWPGGNPETGYLNCDASPTKTILLQGRTKLASHQFWQMAFGKRPSEEMFNIEADRYCVSNVSSQPEFVTLKNSLKQQLFSELREQQDPRMYGKGHLFDEYIYSNAATRNFYERYMAGEKIRAGWVNPSDFEKEPLD